MTARRQDRLPLAALLALGTAAFIAILTEALPAGLLPHMARDLGVTEAGAGQTVTAYALGSLLAAIPLTAATQSLRRRPLLLAAIAGFAIANTVTTVSSHYGLTMASRFVAGVSAGLLWALLAGYAARLVPEHQQGRAIAVAMAGTPLALSLGVPAGSWLGALAGWRLCFAAMSVLALLLMAWVRWGVPDQAGQPPQHRLALRQVLLLPGIRSVLFVVLAFVLAHNILYTYIAPLLVTAGLKERTDLVLLVFGGASLLGIWATGLLIDRHLRTLTLASTALFGAAALALGAAGQLPWAVWLATGAWGLAFGGSATLFQTALAKTARRGCAGAVDIAQSMLVTSWNAAIAGGAMVGGALLQGTGTAGLAPSALALLAAALAVAWSARQHGFAASAPG